jgi:uncharacterized protein YjiS (DUF1127 family)
MKGAIDTIKVDSLHWTGAVRRYRADYVRRITVMLVSMWLRLDRLAERQRSRRALRALTFEQLRDVGLSEQDARREAGRHFWD